MQKQLKEFLWDNRRYFEDIFYWAAGLWSADSKSHLSIKGKKTEVIYVKKWK